MQDLYYQKCFVMSIYLKITVLRNRDIHKPGGLIGEGVAIFFDTNKMSLKEIKLKKSNPEVVAAVGCLPNTKRRIIVIAAYVPPSYSVKRRKSCVQFLHDIINRIKRDYKEPYVVLGGDFNNTDLGLITGSYADIETLPKTSNTAFPLLYTRPAVQVRMFLFPA